jgi:hypothetical protein
MVDRIESNSVESKRTDLGVKSLISRDYQQLRKGSRRLSKPPHSAALPPLRPLERTTCGLSTKDSLHGRCIIAFHNAVWRAQWGDTNEGHVFEQHGAITFDITPRKSSTASLNGCRGRSGSARRTTNTPARSASPFSDLPRASWSA